MLNFLLIGAPEIEAVLVQENQEPMVDLAVEFPHLRFDHERKFVQKISNSISFGRRKIGEMLTGAQEALPNGYRLLIKECYRPLTVQNKFWTEHRESLQKKFPHLTALEIDAECSKYVAPISVAPHSTGGAVDLLLTDSKGRWLPMGSEFNADPTTCENRTYFHSDQISDEARHNRTIFAQVLTSAGFVNYPTEWWHWSYGDKYWAHSTKANAACYSSIEVSSDLR